MRRKGMRLLLVLGLLLGVTTWNVSAAGSAYSVSLTPESSGVKVGSAVSVTVNVTGSDWCAIDLKLKYDSTKLKLTTTASDLGKNYTLTEKTPGEVGIYGFGITDPTLKVSFSALAVGDAELEITSAKFTDSASSVSEDPVAATLPDNPTKITVAPLGYTVSGTAVSWNNTDNAVYVLYPATTEDAAIKAEWKAETPVYTGTVCTDKGSITPNAANTATTIRYDQTFSFSNIAPGSYKLALFKPGKYVPKIVLVTVGTGNVNVGGEIKLWLYGDVTYDGKVLPNDASQITRNVNNLTSVFNNGDTETKADRLLAADLIEDGKVLPNDAAQITRFANNLASIFNNYK